MENATKALLIAGSILIVILLIAMGVRVFNSTSSTTEAVEGTMSSISSAMSNNKFNQYIGERKTTKTVKALADAIIAHNAVAKTEDQKIRFLFYDQFKHIGVYGTNSSGSTNPNTILDAMNNMTTNILWKIEISEVR